MHVCSTRHFPTWHIWRLAQPKCHYKTTLSTAPWPRQRRKMKSSSCMTCEQRASICAPKTSHQEKSPEYISYLQSSHTQLQMPCSVLLHAWPSCRRLWALGVHSCAFLGSLQKVCWVLCLWTHGVLLNWAWHPLIKCLTLFPGDANQAFRFHVWSEIRGWEPGNRRRLWRDSCRSHTFQPVPEHLHCQQTHVALPSVFPKLPDLQQPLKSPH